MSLNIKSGAILIADAHYPHKSKLFYTIIEDLISDKIKTPQLILMGDIFDILFGYSPYLLGYNLEMIDMLNRLSNKIEIIYIEGNHDFLLKDIFINMKIFTRKAQPIYLNLHNQKIALSHGDKYMMSREYNRNTKLMRNGIFLTLMLPFQIKTIKKQIERLKSKKICSSIDKLKFEVMAKSIIKCYDEVDWIVEGHYHQGKIIDNYISLPSLACQKKVAKVIDNKIEFIDIDDLY